MDKHLKITLLDVGWGDSILLESLDDQGAYHFGLIDSHDTTTLRPTYFYLNRFFRRFEHEHPGLLPSPIFDFVLVTHDHADHHAGMQTIIKKFKTRDFWYPYLEYAPVVPTILSWAEREITKPSGCIQFHEKLRVGKSGLPFGNAEVNTLWPPDNQTNIDLSDPNNTSAVLSITLGQHTVVLTGDAEHVVWSNLPEPIPPSTRFFKVPHHGSKNGLFHGGSNTWYDSLPGDPILGISADLRSRIQIFPAKEVTDLFDQDQRQYYRTDRQYHITYETDGVNETVKFSH